MPSQFQYHIPIEITYIVIPIIIVAVLFVFTVFTENKVDATVPAPPASPPTGTPAVKVKVTAFQWGWRYQYPGINVGVTTEDRPTGPSNHGPQMVVAGRARRSRSRSTPRTSSTASTCPSSTSAATPSPGSPTSSTSPSCTPASTGASAPSCAGCTTRSCSSTCWRVSPRSSPVGPGRGGHRAEPAAHRLPPRTSPAHDHVDQRRLAATVLAEGFRMTTTVDSPELIEPEEPGGPDDHGPGAHGRRHPRARARAPRGTDGHPQVADQHRPQADRHELHGHVAGHVLPGRDHGAAAADPAGQPHSSLFSFQTVQRAVHHARQPDAVPVRRALRLRRPGQLHRAAAGRGARHGVPPAQRPVLLAVPERLDHDAPRLPGGRRGRRLRVGGLRPAVRGAVRPGPVPTCGSSGSPSPASRPSSPGSTWCAPRSICGPRA